MKVYVRHIEDVSIFYHEPVFEIGTPSEAEGLVRQIKRSGGIYEEVTGNPTDEIAYQFLLTEERELCCELIVGSFE